MSSAAAMKELRQDGDDSIVPAGTMMIQNLVEAGLTVLPEERWTT